jgi:diguanylate cyclase (GGDEF)-like protein
MSREAHTGAFAQAATPMEARRPSIVVLTGSQVGAVIPLVPKGTVFGRAGDVDVVLDDDGISRVHAMILVEDGRWVVRDLGSTNGTFVAERRVGDTPLQLHEGDRIRCGSDILLRFGAKEDLEREYVGALYQALTRDGLTGLRNRRMLDDLLELEVAWHRQHDLPLSLILIDIDLLTAVNDTFGMAWGNVVLAGIAQVLRDETRAEDIVARVGGEEFAIVLRHTDLESTHELAEGFREACGTHGFILNGRKARVTVSVGVATHEANELTDGNALLAEAESHLFLAKQQGRNRVVSALSG